MVTSDARFPFDTVRGGYGGNEFSALTPEGQRTVSGDAHATTVSSDSPQGAAPAPPVAMAPPALSAMAPAAPAPMAPPVPVAVASAPAATLATSTPTPAQTRIFIDANAFAAVFGPYSVPVKPSAEQLMQLDSLSLVAADATRVVLQVQILACRRAADGCRLAASP